MGGVVVEDWSTFSDHRLVIINTTYQLNRDTRTPEEQFLCETGRRYSSLDFYKAPWDDIAIKLTAISWDQMEALARSSSTDALIFFHEKVLEVLEEIVPVKRKQSNAKPKMHRMRHLLWKRLAKVKNC